MKPDLNFPEGAEEAVEELMITIALSLADWVDKTEQSDRFKKSSVLCALINTLAVNATRQNVPTDTILESVFISIELSRAVTYDNQIVH